MDVKKRTIIFFRHGHKQYDNNNRVQGRPAFDSPLIDGQCADIKDNGIECVLKHDVPDILFYSPYLRTRQTADALLTSLIEHPVICVNLDISEYLGHQRVKPEYSHYPESEMYGILPPVGESTRAFRDRCNNFAQHLLHREQSNVIWVVSHSYVISTVVEMIKGNGYLTERVLEGGYVCITI
jgi:broad specificity phosphatase PhoE